MDNVQEAIQDAQIRGENLEDLMKKLEDRGAEIRRVVGCRQELMETILPVYLTIANAEATANHSNLDGIRFGMREDGESVEEVMMNSRTKGFCCLRAQTFYHRKLFTVCGKSG